MIKHSQIGFTFKSWTLALLLLGQLSVDGQIGGLYTFDFLNLTASARSTALAGFPIAVADDDIAQGYANPALINEKMAHHLSVNHNFHFADISHGFISYGLAMPDKKLSFMIGANYISYGDFDRSDVFGNRSGEFAASENALTIGVSRKMDERLSLGVNLKYVNSSFDTYSSSGMGLDIGLHYLNPEKNSNWAFVIKNAGGQFSTFDIEREAFPFDIQMGYAKRLEHLPFRFMITAHKLQQWNLRSPNDELITTSFIGQDPQAPSGLSRTVDNLFRHLAFGGELLLGKNEVFKLRFGYNHLRNKELAVEGFRSLSGFSFGFGFKVKKLRFDYGVGRYHLAGGVNHLSVSLDLNSFFKKL